MTEERQYQRLAIMLETAVPLAIVELDRRGGPGPDDWAWVAQQVDRFAFGAESPRESDASALLYADRPGETARWFVDLVRILAIASYLPGGIKLFGCRFERQTTWLLGGRH